MRPTDSGHSPAHARHDAAPFVPLARREPDLFSPAHARRVPDLSTPAHARREPDLFTPATPMRDLFAPAHARPAARDLSTPAHARPVPDLSTPAHARPEPAKSTTPRARRARKPAVAEPATVPLPRVRRRRGDTGPIAYALPETPPTGLRKFDLGTVPASVTPPRSWRRAAWFAVGTSAAVVLGLAVAAVELVGRPAQRPMIDALPAYPTGPLTLEQLPVQETSDAPSVPKQPTDPPTRSNTARHSDAPTPDEQEQGHPTDPDTSTPDDSTSAPGGGGTGPVTPTEPAPPTRTTIGPAPVTPTNPEAMGDRTEAYYQLVTENPAAAHEMTTGGMAREGAQGIEARYAGVQRVEVQQITIDRNQAVTTSVVKIVREDGTETIEERRLTFTWGGDPKITDESAAG